MRLVDADTLQYSDARDMLPTGQYVTREEIDKAAEPIRHGHWIYKELGYPLSQNFYICSECGYPHGLAIDNYCPHCGAKMDEVNENETN